MCFFKISPHPVSLLKVQHCTEISRDAAGFSSINQYLIEERICHLVKRVMDLDTGSDYIIKVFHRRTQEAQFQHEVQMIEHASQHPNVIGFREAIDDPDSGKLFIVMEYAEGGQITHVDPNTGLCDRTFPPEQAASLIRELARGVLHLHTHGVLHRDLKPENVLLDKSGRVKIADFGESQIFEPPDDQVDGPGKSIAYSCPESFTCDFYHGKPADVWGIGIVAYAILFGHMPFWGNSHSKLMENVLHASLHVPESTSPQLRDFLSRVLAKDPEHRLTIPQLLTHPWFRTAAASFGVDSARPPLLVISIPASEEDCPPTPLRRSPPGSARLLDTHSLHSESQDLLEYLPQVSPRETPAVSMTPKKSLNEVVGRLQSPQHQAGTKRRHQGFHLSSLANNGSFLLPEQTGYLISPH